jgi:hypothetical protein
LSPLNKEQTSTYLLWNLKAWLRNDWGPVAWQYLQWIC